MIKVLIVDDEPVVRRGLKTVINWESFQCNICGEAANGIEGIKQVQALEPDIVMVDIKMPEMNGLEFIKKIKALGYNCKFIILSGYSDFQFAQNAIKLGVDAYLLKPIEEEELIGLIKRFIQEIHENKIIKEVLNSGTKLKESNLIKLL